MALKYDRLQKDIKQVVLNQFAEKRYAASEANLSLCIILAKDEALNFLRYTKLSKPYASPYAQVALFSKYNDSRN